MRGTRQCLELPGLTRPGDSPSNKAGVCWCARVQGVDEAYDAALGQVAEAEEGLAAYLKQVGADDEPSPFTARVTTEP
jgi:hypothetical protein